MPGKVKEFFDSIDRNTDFAKNQIKDFMSSKFTEVPEIKIELDNYEKLVRPNFDSNILDTTEF